jgi:hypothetical protein
MQAADDKYYDAVKMRFACWITKATDTHSEYVILLSFSRQKCLRERTSILRLYVNCLSSY